jgi:hypothetical protein
MNIMGYNLLLKPLEYNTYIILYIVGVNGLIIMSCYQYIVYACIITVEIPHSRTYNITRPMAQLVHCQLFYNYIK